MSRMARLGVVMISYETAPVCRVKVNKSHLGQSASRGTASAPSGKNCQVLAQTNGPIGELRTPRAPVLDLTVGARSAKNAVSHSADARASRPPSQNRPERKA